MELLDWALWGFTWALYSGLAVTTLIAVCLVGLAASLRCKRALTTTAGETVLGVFHPYCNAGGGGERVLWVALAALDASPYAPNLHVKVYTGDAAEGVAMLKRAKDRFAVDLLADRTMKLSFPRLSCRGLVEASLYPRFTMLGQSVGSVVLGLEALWSAPPHVFLDTTGFAFTYPLAWLAGCTVATYTHYPTITGEMLQRVHDARPTYNNDATITSSTTLTAGKAVYYQVFAAMYAAVGACADVVMVNSSWTKGHIDSLWGFPQSLGDVTPSGAHVVFPPCNTAELQQVPLDTDRRAARRQLVSVAQFRPEKDHRLQIDALAQLRAMGPEFDDVTLHLVGGCRNADDEALVAGLRAHAQAVGVAGAVHFKLNVPFPELRAALAEGTVGLHTMWNEHFGIGVVEMMAAGLVTVAHDSGGPRADIISPAFPHPGAVGMLATTPQQYAAAIAAALRGEVDCAAMTAAARVKASQFSDEVFAAEFLQHLSPALDAVR